MSDISSLNDSETIELANIAFYSVYGKNVKLLSTQIDTIRSTTDGVANMKPFQYVFNYENDTTKMSTSASFEPKRHRVSFVKHYIRL